MGEDNEVPSVQHLENTCEERGMLFSVVLKVAHQLV